MILNLIFSISTALFTAGAAFFFVKSKHARDETFNELDTVRHQVHKYDMIEEELAALAKRFAKLSGRFYRLRQADPDDDLDDRAEYADGTTDPEVNARHETCPNWLLAKQDGPASKAAQCECAFCTRQRIQRHNVKAALVPKSHAARIDAIRKGLEQP